MSQQQSTSRVSVDGRRKTGWMKFGQRMMDVISTLKPNEIKVYLQLGVLCRKPHSGDPSRNIPPTASDEIGIVRAERGRRLTNARLSNLCGVPRTKIGDVLENLIERRLIARTQDGHLRVLNLRYLTGETDEPDDAAGSGDVASHRKSATKGDSATNRDASGRFVPQKVTPSATKGDGRRTPESLEDSEMVAPQAQPSLESDTAADSLRLMASGSAAENVATTPTDPGPVLANPQDNVEGWAAHHEMISELMAMDRTQCQEAWNHDPERFKPLFENVVASRVRHWMEFYHSELDNDQKSAFGRHCSSLLMGLKPYGLDPDRIGKMVLSGIALPWSDECVPIWNRLTGDTTRNLDPRVAVRYETEKIQAILEKSVADGDPSSLPNAGDAQAGFR